MERNRLLLWILSLSTFCVPHWSNAAGPCDPPFLLAVSGITTNSATLDWTPLGMETEWEVAVVLHNSPAPGLPTLAGITSHPVVHPGLSPGTDYDFYVRAVCDSIPGPWAKYNSHFITGLTNPSPCKMGLSVPDEQCINFKIWVDNAPGETLGTDVHLREVRFIMRHTWDDDVDLSLISPDGVTVELSSDNGGNEEHYGNPNDAACLSATVFLSELAPGACDLPSIEAGEAPFIGQFLPEGNLALFNTGADPNAIWTLRVCDDAQNDFGKLEFVELVFEPLVCRAPAIVNVEAVDSTFATLTWMPGDSCLGTIIEYGPPGFFPGTDGNAGPGGTVVAAACPPYVLSGLSPETDYDVYIREACAGGGYSGNSCPVSLTTLCSPLPATHLEDFNDEEICAGICSTPCDLTGSWINSRADQLDWLVLEGETETPGTGPSDDFPGGGKYIYLEGSGACNYNHAAVLYSHCLWITAPQGTSCHFSFDYHMYGTAVNSLELDISTNGGLTWDTLWLLSGNQGERWVRQFIDLSNYDGEIAQLRFVGKKGNNVRSDIGLDNLVFYGPQDLGTPPYTYFQDLDQDGYGNDEVFFSTCAVIAPPGFSPVGGDCFDLSDLISPGLPETPCDSFDINCNGMDDEWVLPAPETFGDSICSGEFGLVEALPGYGGTIVWYDAPAGGNPLDTGLVYFPNPPPEQTGNVPAVYNFYAEEVGVLGCLSAERDSAGILVYPKPDIFVPPGQLEPVCAGTAIDLSGLIVQDLTNSFGDLTFHDAYPPDPANQIDPPVVHPLFSRTYYIMSTADGGCTDTDSVLVLVKDSPIAQITGDSLLCKGGSQVLTVEDQGNGVAPLEYVWSNASNATSIFILGSGPAGSIQSYGVTITDANGCRSSDEMEVEIIGAITAVNVSEQDVSICGGNNGAISLGITGGVAPFHFDWDGPVPGSGDSGIPVFTITGLTQGAYSITITDSSPNPCPFVVPLAIVNGPQAHVHITSVQPVSCSGSADGCIELFVEGVDPQITWSTGDSGLTTLCGLEGGIYSVTVTEGACENILTGIEVPEPDSLLGEVAFLKNAGCFGSADGEIHVVIGGGTGPYQYLWSDNQTTANLLAAAAGGYSLTITDDMGCQLIMGPFEITEPTAILWTMLETPVPCFEGKGGALEVLVSGGSEPYGYEWSTGSNLSRIENLQPGTYWLTITDNTGCSVVTLAVLENPPPLSAEVILLDPPTCFGIEDGQIALAAAGGTPPYTFDWSDGATGPVRVLPDGVYDVTVTDSQGCAFFLADIALVAPNPVSVLPVITPASCLGKEDGQIQLTPQSGQLPFDYLWEGGQTGPLLQDLVAGEYFCTITDDNGCITTPSFIVGFSQPISANITPLGPNCFNGSNGKIFLTPMGGTPFYSYQWSNGQQTKDLLNVPSGAYVCTITDLEGCKLIIDTVELFNPPPILIELLALDSISCNGNSDGAIDMGVSGGIPPYIFTWNTEETTQDLEQVGGGIYILTVEDSLSCAVNSVPVVLPEPPPLSLDAQAVDVIIICQSNSIDTLLLQIEGGSAPYQILWSNGQQEPFVLGSPPGDYSVTVTDAQGCVDSLTSLKVPEPVPFLTLSVSTNFSFSGDCEDPASAASLTVHINGGKTPFQYNWNVGVQGTTSSHTLVLNNLVEDTYSVTVTDAVGCVAATNPVQVNFPDPLNAVITGASIGDVACKYGAEGYIHPVVNGGDPPYQFIWTDQWGATVGVAKNLDSIPAGIYTLQVIDQNECTATIEGIEVSEPQFPLEVSIDVDHLDCFGDNDGSITVFPAGGTPLYQYTWSVPGGDPFLENLPAGLYFLTVEDSNGCMAALDSIVVNGPDAPLAMDSYNISPILCYGSKEGAIDIEISGGVQPYDYIWNNGALTQDIAGLGPGNYKCTIVDANGCQFITPLFILTNPPDLQVVEVQIDTATLGLPDGALTVVVEGGVMPYTYLWSNGDTTATADSLFSDFYGLTVTDANGCILEVQAFLPFLIPDGTEEPAEGNFRIYPNPAKGTVWVEVSAAGGAGLEVRVLDILGRPLAAFRPGSEGEGIVEISLGGFPAGVYEVRVWSGTRFMGKALLAVFTR